MARQSGADGAYQSRQDQFSTNGVGDEAVDESLEWLARHGREGAVKVIDLYDLGGPLMERTAAAGWSTQYERVEPRWSVFVETFPDHHRANALARPVIQSRTFPNSTGGAEQLLNWLGKIGPVNRMSVTDLAPDGDNLVSVLNTEGFDVSRRRATRGRLPSRPSELFGEVQVHLSFKGLGWILLDLNVGDIGLKLTGSYMSSPWEDTLTALADLLDGAGQVSPAWVDEPGSHRLVMTPKT